MIGRLCRSHRGANRPACSAAGRGGSGGSQGAQCRVQLPDVVGFLQDRFVAPHFRYVFAAVAGGEHERDAAAAQHQGRGKAGFAGQVDVEDRQVDGCKLGQLQASGQSCSLEHAIARGAEAVFQHHRQHHLVFGEQDAGQLAVGGHQGTASSGTSMVQVTPLGGNSSVTSPSSSYGTPSLIRRVPKPRRVGGSTVGPPVSVHCSCSHGRWPCRRVVQVTVTRPSGTDSEPYLPALVASSCKAMLSASACFGGRLSSSPCRRTRASFVRASSGRYGASSLLMTPVSGAPSHASCASRLCVCDSASSRDRKLSLKVGRSGAVAMVWWAIACTVASVFFTR